jgi:transcription factor STE12
MYSTQHAVMAGQPQARSVAPETFLLDQDAQQSLPPDSVVALQQVDNRMSSPHPLPPLSCPYTPVSPPMEALALTDTHPVKYFLISAPVDWSPDQYIRRFLLPTGEYVSCVLWYVFAR